MKKAVKYSFISIASLVIVVATLSIPKSVDSKKDMEAIQFGYPISFITQDLTHYDPPFPWKYSFSSPLENPFSISWVNFLTSYLITLTITGLAVSGIEGQLKKK